MKPDVFDLFSITIAITALGTSILIDWPLFKERCIVIYQSEFVKWLISCFKSVPLPIRSFVLGVICTIITMWIIHLLQVLCVIIALNITL
jgi:energy-converting hydrogenase Eha subunit C